MDKKKKKIIIASVISAFIAIWIIAILCVIFIPKNQTPLDSNGEIGGNNNENNTPDEHIHYWFETYTEDGEQHYQTCTGCDLKLYNDHTYINSVCVCGKTNYTPSEGLIYTLNKDGQSYTVSKGTATAKDVVIAAEYQGKPVTAIASKAFKGTSLKPSLITSIYIPDSITTIGDEAFYLCTSLTSITIPDSVTYIDYWAFAGCSSLESITVAENNLNYKSVNGNLYSKDGKTLILYAIGKTETSFSIPNSVTSIGDEAFYLCTSLTSITIPDSVTYIDYWAFGHCSSLTSITIPNSVIAIDYWAFAGCSSLTSITIPDSVTYIGYGAFQVCTSLTSITFDGTVAQWNAISKVNNWDLNTGDYTIYCTDGEIAKDGTVTMY